MNPRVLISRLLLFLAVLISIGCNKAYQQSMRKAREAETRGDLLTAARAYREACDLAPSEEEACSQVPLFAQRAIDQAIEAVRPACEAGELDQCLPRLVETRDLMPSHPELLAILMKASQLHIERCTQWDSEPALNTAAAGLACLQSRSHQFPFPHYQSLLMEKARLLASRFTVLAATAENQGAPGAAALFWSTAKCLAPSDDMAWRAKQAHQEFLAVSAIPVTTELVGSIPREFEGEFSDLCQSFSQALPRWAQCESTGAKPGQREAIRVHVDALIQPVQSILAQEERKSIQYVTGTKEVPNPEYRQAKEQLEEAEQALQSAGQHKESRQRLLCTAADAIRRKKCVGCPLPSKEQDACGAKEQTLPESREVLTRKRNEARDKLEKTPELIKQDEHDTFVYSVRRYRWTSAFRFSITTNSPGDIKPIRHQGAVVFEDQEHPGFGGARLEENPLTRPPQRDFARGFIRELRPYWVNAIVRDGQLRGAARRLQCNDFPASWSISSAQCWAEASLWSNQQGFQTAKLLRLIASTAGATGQVECL